MGCTEIKYLTETNNNAQMNWKGIRKMDLFEEKLFNELAGLYKKMIWEKKSGKSYFKDLAL